MDRPALADALKNKDVVLTLPNDHYTVHLDSMDGTQLNDFFVNGAALTALIPSP